MAFGGDLKGRIAQFNQLQVVYPGNRRGAVRGAYYVSMFVVDHDGIHGRVGFGISCKAPEI